MKSVEENGPRVEPAFELSDVDTMHDALRVAAAVRDGRFAAAVRSVG